MTQASVIGVPHGAPVDKDKRNWIVATCAVGGAGVAAVAVPFVSTFQPSERAKATGAAVEVDISALKPGEKMTVEWRGKPVWIVKRTPEQLASLMYAPVADTSRLRTLFGFEPQRTSAEAFDDFAAGCDARPVYSKEAVRRAEQTIADRVSDLAGVRA